MFARLSLTRGPHGLRRNRSHPPFIAAALLGALSAATAATVQDARALEGELWYTVSIMGQRVGYAYTKITVDEEDPDGPLLRVEDAMQAQVQLQQGTGALPLESQAVSTFDSNLHLLRTELSSNQFGRSRTVRARVLPDAIEVDVSAGGTDTHKSLPLTEMFGSDMDMAVAIARGEARVGDTLKFDAFDPELVALDSHTVTITGTTALPDGTEAFVVSTRRQRLPIEIITVIAPDGTPVSISTPAVLDMKLQRATQEEALAAAAPLMLSAQIPANREIPDPRRLQSLRARITAGPQEAAELIPSSSRQSVQADGEAAIVSIIRGVAAPDGAAFPVADPDLAAYTKTSDIAQTDHPTLVARAREIVGEETDAQKAAGKIVRWVYEHVTKVKSEPRPVSALEVLQELSGDCTEHAILAGALCGAVGIPARMVVGVAYAHNSFYYHAWNEIHAGQWVEMDPAWGELEVDAGHIRLADGSLDLEAISKIGLAAARSLDLLQVEILDHTLTGDTQVPAAQEEDR